MRCLLCNFDGTDASHPSGTDVRRTTSSVLFLGRAGIVGVLPALVHFLVAFDPRLSAAGLVPLKLKGRQNEHDRADAHDPHVDGDPQPGASIVNLLLVAHLGHVFDVLVVLPGEVEEGVPGNPSRGGDVLGPLQDGGVMVFCVLFQGADSPHGMEPGACP